MGRCGEKSENFLFLHFATAHTIFQLFRNSIFRVLILRFLIMFKNFQQNFNEISKTFSTKFSTKFSTNFSLNFRTTFQKFLSRRRSSPLCVTLLSAKRWYIFQALQDLHTFATLQSQNFSKKTGLKNIPALRAKQGYTQGQAEPS